MGKFFSLGVCEQIEAVSSDIDSNLVFLSLFRVNVSNWIGKTLNESLLSATETSESTFTILCYNFSHQKMGFFGDFFTKKPSDTQKYDDNYGKTMDFLLEELLSYQYIYILIIVELSGSLGN